MSNVQFWKKLDRITSKKQTFESTCEFLKVLAEGYSKNLDILILCVEDPNNENLLNQACLMNDGKKLMLYYTDKRHIKDCKKLVPAGSMYDLKCRSVYIRDVIDNAMEKDEVEGLIFNNDTKNKYVIPKFLLVLRFMFSNDLVSEGDDE